MKFKKEVPNMYDFLKSNTVNFIQNEKNNCEIEHVNNVKINSAVSQQPHKIDYLKINTGNFIQNEKIFNDSLHPSNTAKFSSSSVLSETESCQKGKVLAKSHGNLTSLAPEVIEENWEELISPRWTEKHYKPEDMTVTTSRIEYNGSSPKRYTTTCYMKPKTVPIWYTESVILNIGSTKKVYKEEVFFKNKLQPHYWSEFMVTDVNLHGTRTFKTKQIDQESSTNHFVSLEPQQLAVA